jgi:polyphosphate kinase 2 (PPK2 family)
MRSAVQASPLAEDLTGLRVDSDDEDDPVLLRPDGSVVDTWREDYPYAERMTRAGVRPDKRLLQIELIKLQNWVKSTGQRIVLLFEGRDAAGKGGTIKRFTEHLNPRGAQVVALEKPSERERTQWYFQRYVSHLPAAGEIVLFDRSWYNRAGVERVMGFCSRRRVPRVHASGPGLRADAGPLRHLPGQVLVLGLPVRAADPLRGAQIDPVRQWKLSPMDLASLDRWDAYTEAKEAMFFYTDTADAPWTV